MELSEIIKNVLFIIAEISGTVMLISLFIICSIKLTCIALDHLKVGNMIREALVLYIKLKRPDLKTKNISFKVK